MSQVLKQCCSHDPVWMFIYSDGVVFAICENDFSCELYQKDVKKVINIKTGESFAPENIFGGK